MRFKCLPVILCGLLCCSVLAVATPQAASNNPQLDLGVQSYKAARYEEAFQHFQKAVEIEPTNIRAHLYLGAALAQQYIPGADSAENVRLGELAVEQYYKVMALDPSSMNAVKAVAYLNLQMKKFELAKGYYQKATEIDPKDPEPYYTIAVIDWTQAYQPRMELRAKLGLKPEQQLIGNAECWQVREANSDRIEDGIEMLKKAIELRHDYDDAMAYMNLMYRERADIRCGDSKARAADLKTAAEWVDLTLAIKKRKAEQKDKRRKDGATRGNSAGTTTTIDFSTAPNPQ
jgi:tetratricopeptide (TPR) repeat protein